MLGTRLGGRDGRDGAVGTGRWRRDEGNGAGWWWCVRGGGERGRLVWDAASGSERGSKRGIWAWQSDVGSERDLDVGMMLGADVGSERGVQAQET